ncbi:MAG: acyl-CoA dehydrogenase family protein [Chelatococcus sp.]|nr:acyl-CoA dehydrogenase family protein [Chelatococcus sp. YT9]MBX3557456.1 acyl-CoA dehydrogenase family protein [Chelatococcus sp.]
MRSEDTQEQAMFRRSVRTFMRGLAEQEAGWEEAGMVPRSVWLEAGELGILGPTVPSEYGGLDLDRRFAAIAIEEQARALLGGPGFCGHSNMTTPYITRYGSEEQKAKWLPKTVTGEIVMALAMTEPDAGSDLQNIRTTAIRDGDDYVVNGSKIFITNGISADLVIVACKTDPAARGRGISLFVVEADRAGFRKGRNLKKLGRKIQDTAELFFDDVRVPHTNLLGNEGEGFRYMKTELAWERIQASVEALGACEGMMDATIEYTRNRKAFGRTVSEFQNTRFKLAELATEIQVIAVMVDRCMDLVCEDSLDASIAAMAKLKSTELQGRVADECLQLHGGNGYMLEYPICRAFADARIQRIWAGTSEIMKEIIARDVFS